MDKQEQLRQKVNSLARDINNMRHNLASAIQHEEFELAAQLRDDAHGLQHKLLHLINTKDADAIIKCRYHSK